MGDQDSQHWVKPYDWGLYIARMRGSMIQKQSTEEAHPEKSGNCMLNAKWNAWNISMLSHWIEWFWGKLLGRRCQAMHREGLLIACRKSCWFWQAKCFDPWFLSYWLLDLFEREFVERDQAVNAWKQGIVWGWQFNYEAFFNWKFSRSNSDRADTKYIEKVLSKGSIMKPVLISFLIRLSTTSGSASED